MKKLFLLFALLYVSQQISAQTKADVDAAITKFRGYYNQQQPDSIYTMLSERGKSLLPLDKARQAFGGLHQQCGDLGAFEMIKESGALFSYKLTFEHILLTLLISLNKDNKLEDFNFRPYKEEAPAGAVKERSNFSIKAGDDSLYGTIVMPRGDKKVPVVLIIAGSGPTDRDCNSDLGLTCNAFKMLADSLKQAGIASLRYDKRGVGESERAVKDRGSITLNDFIADAEACIKALKADRRFSKVYVLGHSEGSLIGMVAAQKQAVAGFISLSGPGESMDKLIERQLTTQSKEMGAIAKVILDSVKKGYTVNDVPDQLQPLLNTGIQPYLRSCMKYDPQAEIRKLKIPVLLVQGTTDLQVSLSDAELLKKAHTKATLKFVTGMNHVLKQAPMARQLNFATYNQPTLALSEGLVPPIVDFINHAR